MEKKRKIRAKGFVRDVRSGKSQEQLMEKHALSLDELELVVKRLVTAGLLENDETGASFAVAPDREDADRRSARCYLATVLPVYDLDDLQAEGQLHDISKTGIKVSGIESQMGEEKNLVIEVSHAADLYPLCIRALCRWTKTEPDGSLVAGFEVTTWPAMADEVIEKIAKFLALCDET